MVKKNTFGQLRGPNSPKHGFQKQIWPISEDS